MSAGIVYLKCQLGGQTIREGGTQSLESAYGADGRAAQRYTASCCRVECLEHYACFLRTKTRARTGDDRSRRRGATAVVVIITLSVLVGMASLVIDVSHLYFVRQELQHAADAGALAAAWTLFDENGDLTPLVAEGEALAFAALNSADGVHELDFGWIEDPFDLSSPFVPTAVDQANAVRVAARRTSDTGNPVHEKKGSGYFFSVLSGRFSLQLTKK